MGGGLTLSFVGKTFLNLNKMGARFIEAKWERVLLKQNDMAFLQGKT